MLSVVWDMETIDPDDFLTLLFLLDHLDVNLKAVTITPGSPYQVGLVRKALQWFGKDLPVGAFNIHHEKVCVSSWHGKAFGEVTPSMQALTGAEVLLEHCDANTTLITGAPLKNLGAAMALAESKGQILQVGRWVAQGGFAGEGVVPLEKQLEKFKGKTTCATFNLGGDYRSSLKALEYEGIGEKYFVSKNVCHGVIYDRDMHAQLSKIKHKRLSLELIWKGMEVFLQGKSDGQGKKMHDPLAACCAIDSSIGEWAEVSLYREKGEWGSKLKEGSNTKIIIDYDRKKFLQTFFA